MMIMVNNNKAKHRCCQPASGPPGCGPAASALSDPSGPLLPLASPRSAPLEDGLRWCRPVVTSSSKEPAATDGETVRNNCPSHVQLQSRAADIAHFLVLDLISFCTTIVLRD